MYTPPELLQQPTRMHDTCPSHPLIKIQNVRERNVSGIHQSIQYPYTPLLDPHVRQQDPLTVAGVYCLQPAPRCQFVRWHVNDESVTENGSSENGSSPLNAPIHF